MEERRGEIREKNEGFGKKNRDKSEREREERRRNVIRGIKGEKGKEERTGG